MKPDLSLAYDYPWAGVPAGMPSGDFLIWDRFRRMFGSMFSKIYYNVRVGDPSPVPGGLPDEIQKMAEDVSRRRIDVVGEKADSWILIEVKYNAGPEALGQILMYKELWNQDPPDGKPVYTAIVTDRTAGQVSFAVKQYGVLLFVV